jgi:hypothetical protein
MCFGTKILFLAVEFLLPRADLAGIPQLHAIHQLLQWVVLYSEDHVFPFLSFVLSIESADAGMGFLDGMFFAFFVLAFPLSSSRNVCWCDDHSHERKRRFDWVNVVAGKEDCFCFRSQKDLYQMSNYGDGSDVHEGEERMRCLFRTSMFHSLLMRRWREEGSCLSL